MSVNTQKKTNNGTEESRIPSWCYAMGIIIGCSMVVALFAGLIYHVYLSIAGLAGVSNKDIRALCNSSAVYESSDYTYIGENPSEIWMYVLMSLIFVSGGLVNNAKSTAGEDGKEVGIGPIIFRDEEDILDGDRGTVDFYDNVIVPYKGQVEAWYADNQHIFVYFLLILMTVWIIVFPKSDVIWKVFRDLPVPPGVLKTTLNFPY